MIFRFSTGSRFGFQNASKMRSPGIPKLEKVVSGISSFLGVVFGSTFDEKWPQKGTSKSIRNMSIRCFLADPLPGGAPGFIFDRFLIDFWFWDRFLNVFLMIFMHGMPCFLFVFICSYDWIQGILLRYWCLIPTILMWNDVEFPVVLLRDCCDIAVAWLWDFCDCCVDPHDIIMVLLWDCFGIAVIVLWVSHGCCGIEIWGCWGLLRYRCGIHVEFLWDWCGISWDFAGDCCDIAMVVIVVVLLCESFDCWRGLLLHCYGFAVKMLLLYCGIAAVLMWDSVGLMWNFPRYCWGIAVILWLWYCCGIPVSAGDYCYIIIIIVLL